MKVVLLGFKKDDNNKAIIGKFAFTSDAIPKVVVPILDEEIIAVVIDVGLQELVPSYTKVIGTDGKSDYVPLKSAIARSDLVRFCDMRYGPPKLLPKAPLNAPAPSPASETPTPPPVGPESVGVNDRYPSRKRTPAVHFNVIQPIISNFVDIQMTDAPLSNLKRTAEEELKTAKPKRQRKNSNVIPPPLTTPIPPSSGQVTIPISQYGSFDPTSPLNMIPHPSSGQASTLAPSTTSLSPATSATPSPASPAPFATSTVASSNSSVITQSSELQAFNLI